MSRTYKKYPAKYLRRPRGRLRAIREDARKRSVPPDAWNDIPHDDICYIPASAARNMARDGIPRLAAINKLRKKFKLTYREATYATWYAYECLLK